MGARSGNCIYTNPIFFYFREYPEYTGAENKKPGTA
jgi:hypothetical protein